MRVEKIVTCLVVTMTILLSVAMTLEIGGTEKKVNFIAEKAAEINFGVTEANFEIETTTSYPALPEDPSKNQNVSAGLTTNESREVDQHQKSDERETENESENDIFSKPIYDSINFTDISDKILSWDAPKYYKENFPYYHSGYDDEGRPVWISEMGKYPIEIVGAQGEQSVQELIKYVGQAALRVIKSIQVQNATYGDIHEGIFIVDADGVKLSKLLNPNFVILMVRVFVIYKNLILDFLGSTTVINMTYPAELAVNTLKPILGRAMEKVELFGTNKEKWMTVLRRRLPQDVIPPWYGGAADYRPVKVYAE